MICKTGCCNVLVPRVLLYILISYKHTYTYIHKAYKLTYLRYVPIPKVVYKKHQFLDDYIELNKNHPYLDICIVKKIFRPLFDD